MTVFEIADRIVSLIPPPILRLLCSIDEHGPFHIPSLSTADSAPAPDVYCSSCGAECTDLFTVSKSGGCVVVINHRRNAAVFVGMDSGIIVPRCGSTVYRRGAYLAGPDGFPTRDERAVTHGRR